jgi:Fe-S-cluster containining protein
MENLRCTVSSLRDFQHSSKKILEKHIAVPEWENEKRNTEVGTLFDYGAKCCSSPRQRVITHLERRQNSACQPRAAEEATEAAASKQTAHWILEKASKRCIGFRNSNTEERYNDEKSMFCVSMSAACWYCSWPDAAASNNAHATTLFLKCSRFRVLSSQ